jgi:hypothetical protein
MERHVEFPSEKFERYSKGTFFLILVLSVLTIPVWIGRIERKLDAGVSGVAKNVNERLNTFSGRLDARDKQVGLLLTDMHTYAEQNYWDVYALNETAVTTARQFSEFVRKVDIQVNGGEGKTGLLDEAHALLKQTREKSLELEADLHKVLVSTDATLVPLKQALSNVATLTSNLDRQLTTSGAGVAQIAKDLDKAIDHVDQLLTDPHIKATLANVDESTKTVEIAIRPWREKARLLKVILGKVLSMAPGVAVAIAK